MALQQIVVGGTEEDRGKRLLNQLLFATLNGLATGLAVFLVAAGLTLVFGILRILNFAHGSFFMIGAYIAFTFVGSNGTSIAMFLAVSLAAGLVVGLIGYITNIVLFKRVGNVDEVYTLIATFALLLFCNGVVKLIWGIDFRSVSPPDALSGVVQIGSTFMASFSIFIVLIGVVVFGVLEVLINRVWIGKIVKAVARDPWMASMSGINVPMVYAGAVVFSFFLAGLAGGLLLPNQSLSPNLSNAFLLQAFVVVIIGGLGDIRGAFLASILLGLVQSLNTVLIPGAPGIAVYVMMIIFLVWRPQGLLSRGQARNVGHESSAKILDDAGAVLSGPVVAGSGIVIALFLLSLPFWVNQGLLSLVGITLIEALFALAWNLLFGVTGIVVFGHAAFFGLGAYLTALMLKSGGGASFLAVTLGAGLAGAAAAYVVGIIALRRTVGIAFAILTLSVGEIMHLVITYSPNMGGEDGIFGIPRPTLELGFMNISLGSNRSYFWFICVVVAMVSAVLWRLVKGEFGRVLRSIRQDPERVEFLGVNVGRYRLIALVISGGIASFAGAIWVPWVQVVSPQTIDYLHSAQPMLNALLGGSNFFWGPAVGAALFSILAYSTRTLAGLSEIVTGGVLLIIVLGAPAGILGVGNRLFYRLFSRRETSQPLNLPKAEIGGAL